MIRQPVQAVIFDCDGTLVDSETISMELLLEGVTPLGIRMTHDEAMVRFAGNDLKVVLAELEATLNTPLPLDFLPNFRRRQFEVLAERLQPVDGAMELLGSLSLPFCVASNAPRQKIRICLETTGLIAHCSDDRIFSAYDVDAWKPDPKLFLAAAEALQVAPADCLVVEDSVFGIEAAHSAGMQVIAFDPHGSLPKNLENTCYVSHLSQVGRAI
ncbi:6-phosphogluconate phosphatase [Rubripirellula amarantea]|uniref:6-phosphogluconate phosphatase n=1 Tax=Rubripirellula amarantea TaxID=2527999 RepID=A0A5C5WYM1_9BACT|nr:HAD-IA family hydrolase [Rubripirellula amarantea]TWT54992.1 6-phosphogluconate phosphatase [Rubripirellula amarantea]